MISIGITGNLGSGKTSVARIWRDERGIVLIEADQLGREAARPGGEVLKELAGRFGVEILLEDGSLDRHHLARIAFSSDENRRALNSIVHPEILRLIGLELQKALRDGARAVVVDAALIFDFGLENFLHYVVTVDAPREMKIERMLAKGKLDRATLERILEMQLPADELKAKADYVIENDGDLENLRRKALEVFGRMLPE